MSQPKQKLVKVLNWEGIEYAVPEDSVNRFNDLSYSILELLQDFDTEFHDCEI